MEPQQGSVDDVAKILNEDRERDFANALAITARQRKGKSRLAHLIVEKTYPNFTYAKNYLGNPKHGASFNTLMAAEHKSTNWIDEAEKILSTEMRMEKDQWWLNQLFNQFGSHNKIIIFCTPDFLRIDPRWRRTHITIWIYLLQRGVGVVLKNRDLQSAYDTWGLKTMSRYEADLKASELTSEKRLQAFSRNPAFLFWFKFPDWSSPEEEQEYLKWKTLSQADLNKEHTDWQITNGLKQESYRLSKAHMGLGRVFSHLNTNYNISYNELARVSGYSQETARELTLDFENSAISNPSMQKQLPHSYFNKAYFGKLSKKLSINRKL